MTLLTSDAQVAMSSILLFDDDKTTLLALLA